MKAEVRGRARAWKVFYANEAGLASPFAVYDCDGLLKDVIRAGAPDKEPWTECHVEFASVEAACEYARYLGASDVNVVRKLTREQALDKARAAKKETST